MADTELLPCPFCGGADVSHDAWESLTAEGPGCDECGATAATDADWNRRATPPSPSTAPEVDERAAFEAKYRGMLDLMPCAENDSYMAYSTYCAWRAWKDRGAALASRPAEVDNEGLPALPQAKAWRFRSYDGREECHSDIWQFTDIRRVMEIHQHHKAIIEPLFTAEQYRQGQRDAVAADRARRREGKS
jgi:hypothetical protein